MSTVALLEMPEGMVRSTREVLSPVLVVEEKTT